MRKKIREIHAIMIMWKKAPGPRKKPGAFAMMNSALETRLPRDLGEGPALGAYWLPEPPGNPGRPEGASAENKAGWGLALVDPPAGGGVQVPACPMSTAARRRDKNSRALLLYRPGRRRLVACLSHSHSRMERSLAMFSWLGCTLPASHRETMAWSTPICSASWAWVSFLAFRAAAMSNS